MLPPEIWLRIFYFATRPEKGYETSSYEPFRGCFRTNCADALGTRKSLVRVCRVWRALSIAFLYEDVLVRRDVDALRGSLESDQFGLQDGPHTPGPGRWVRRLELPYIQTETNTPSSLDNVLHILRCCPSIQTLVRPYCNGPRDGFRYDFPADIVSLSCLTRLDWWHYDEAARTGGINSLAHVVRNAPCLQYLTLGGVLRSSISSFRNLELPALTTLRLRRVNPMFVRCICGWVLPSLAHVVVDFPPENDALELLWSTFGQQLCTVEFGRGVAFRMSDQIGLLLRTCPTSIKVLNYFIYFSVSPNPPIEEHTSMETVGINAFPCELMLDDWDNVSKHLSWLVGPSLTALKHVILYGDWERFSKDGRFLMFQKGLMEKGCSVQLVAQVSLPICGHLASLPGQHLSLCHINRH
ncbi:hypothetical protein ID866_8323 [Astraeus odoratus]|nr:hypothetical protein ID866_8323 [Astraeus odoratus]